MNSTLSGLGVVAMDEFIAERVKLVRQLANRADPFTEVRLLKLTERYDEKLGPSPTATRQREEPFGLPPISIGER